MRSSVRCSCLPPTPPFLSSHRSDFVLTSLFSPRRDTGQQCALPGGWQLYRYRGVRIYRLGKEVKEKIKKKGKLQTEEMMINPAGKAVSNRVLSSLLSLKRALMRRGEHLRPLPQLLSHCAAVCPGRLIRLPAPLPSASFLLWIRVPARTIVKSYAPGLQAGNTGWMRYDDCA